jgi:tRNA pseudouridine65 synthase/23S rRNA pseudouridine1911/1915/1917 synthase
MGLFASRQGARKALRRGELLLNGKTAESSRFVGPGDVLEYRGPTTVPPPPYALELSVAHEDGDLAVVIKPPGLLTHGNVHRSLERALGHNLTRSSIPDALPVPGPVHRLDRATGGLVLVAKTRRARVSLGRQFQARTIRKTYRAIVVGELQGQGWIDEPVDGREARTHYRAIARWPSLHVGSLSEVELSPHTGRTHQLRRHLAGLGHPILGDSLYTDGRLLRGQGLFLWAQSLTFQHPRSGIDLHIEAPPPHKFEAFLRREERRWLRAREGG